MADHGGHCSHYTPQNWRGFVEIMENRNTSKEQKKLIEILRRCKLTVNLGAGRQESLDFDDANELYLSRHFPSLDKEVYCCPPVLDYRYRDEPSDIIEEASDDAESLTENVKYDTHKRKRRGELAEEHVIRTFMAMLRKYKMPSFIIHGYDWRGKYLRTISKLSPKFLKKVSKEGGEIDLLILIFGKFLITVEVKAGDNPDTIQPVIEKGFTQCEKTATFLTDVNSDLLTDKNVSIVKVVALPNFDKSNVDQFDCGVCSPHILTKRDLECADRLHEWFTRLTTKCSTELDQSTYEGLIGRLIGPSSLVEVRTIPESVQRTVSQIMGEYGTADKIQERWYQLNPEQLVIKFNDPKALLLTGEPGSGKTVLALWKIHEILKEADWTGDSVRTVYSPASDQDSAHSEFFPPPMCKGPRSNVCQGLATAVTEDATEIQENIACSPPIEELSLSDMTTLEKYTPLECADSNTVVESSSLAEMFPNRRHSVLYLIAGTRARCLQQIFRNRMTNAQLGTCELIITTVDDISVVDQFLDCQNLPHFILLLQKRHPSKTVHVIMDEAPWIIDRVDFDKFRRDWERLINHERMGFVWIIQQTDCAEWDSCTDVLPKFHTFHLNYIMRMSKENVTFTNLILGVNYRSGHAVSGNGPIVYTMGCVCLQQKEQTCDFCHGVRSAWLIQKALCDFQITREGRFVNELGFSDIAFLSRHYEGISEMLKLLDPPISFILSEYPTLQSNAMTVCAVGDFRGCEQSMIIADFDSAGCGSSKECLTRTLGQLIILDSGCIPVAIRKYEELIGKIEVEAYMGNVDLREVEPSELEIRCLRRLLIPHLGNEILEVDKSIKETESGVVPSSAEMKAKNMDRYRKRKESIMQQIDELETWLASQ